MGLCTAGEIGEVKKGGCDYTSAIRCDAMQCNAYKHTICPDVKRRLPDRKPAGLPDLEWDLGIKLGRFFARIFRQTE